jgi:hypothetical protein
MLLAGVHDATNQSYHVAGPHNHLVCRRGCLQSQGWLSTGHTCPLPSTPSSVETSHAQVSQSVSQSAS